MSKEEGTGEPIYLELVDALELYAAIIGGTLAQAADQLRSTTPCVSSTGADVRRAQRSSR